MYKRSHVLLMLYDIQNKARSFGSGAIPIRINAVPVRPNNNVNGIYLSAFIVFFVYVCSKYPPHIVATPVKMLIPCDNDNAKPIYIYWSIKYISHI